MCHTGSFSRNFPDANITQFTIKALNETNIIFILVISAIQHLHCTGGHRELDPTGQVPDHDGGGQHVTELPTLQAGEDQSLP